MAAKTRKANWSAAETAVLVEMCTANSELLNCKFSNTFSAADRTKFWAECGEKVNSIGGANRSVVEVIKKWTEMKSSTKKKERKRVFEAKQTGGGPSADKLNELEEKILSVLPSVVTEGIVGGVDSFQGVSDSNILQHSNKTENKQCNDTENKENEPSTSNAGKSEFVKKRKLSDQGCLCSQKLLKIEEEMLQETRHTRNAIESINKTLQELLEFKRLKNQLATEQVLFENF